MKKIIMLSILLFVSLKGNAGIIEINESEFSTTSSESFETLWGLYLGYDSTRGFDDTATITGDNQWTPGQIMSVSNGGWDVETVHNGTVRQLTDYGNTHLAIGLQGYVDIVFDSNIFSFGGYFSNGFISQSKTSINALSLSKNSKVVD